MNTLYTTYTCLYILVSLKEYFSLLECDEYQFKTKGYCEIPDYDKYQIPPYPPLKVNISLGNMVNFKRYAEIRFVLERNQKKTFFLSKARHQGVPGGFESSYFIS